MTIRNDSEMKTKPKGKIKRSLNFLHLFHTQILFCWMVLHMCKWLSETICVHFHKNLLPDAAKTMLLLFFWFFVVVFGIRFSSEFNFFFTFLSSFFSVVVSVVVFLYKFFFLSVRLVSLFCIYIWLPILLFGTLFFLSYNTVSLLWRSDFVIVL